MKDILLAIVQFVMFLVVFAVGSFVAPLHMRQVLGVTSEGTRIFIWDGVALMLGLFVVIVLIEAARKRLRSARWTALALALAVAAGFAMKLGFLTA